MALRDSFRFLLPILVLTPGLAQAQTAQAPSPDIQRQRIEQLQELIRTKKDLQESLLKMQQTTQQQLAEFDARIAALEASLGVTPSENKPAQANPDAVAVTPPKDKPAQGNPDTSVSTAALASPAARSMTKAQSHMYKVPLLRKKNWVHFPT
jgi:septal ring factor EnvC (AmiA/AmiB activator)